MNSLQFKSCIIYHVGASSCAPAPNRTRFDLGLGANQFACIFLAAIVSPTPRNLPVTGGFLQSGGTWRRSAHLLIKLFSKSILSTAQLRNGKVPEPCAFLIKPYSPSIPIQWRRTGSHLRQR